MKPLRAELLKLGTLPAVPLTAAVTVAATVLLALAAASASDRGQVLDVLLPLRYAQAGFLVLGVLAAASEYRHGTIRITLVAMPRRFTVQLAKAATLAAVATPVAAVAVAVAVAGSPPTVATSLGITSQLALCALSASAVATTTRQATPAAAIVLVLYFVACPLLRAATGLGPYLPDAVFDPDGNVLAPAVWALAALTAAACLFDRRDA